MIFTGEKFFKFPSQSCNKFITLHACNRSQVQNKCQFLFFNWCQTKASPFLIFLIQLTVSTEISHRMINYFVFKILKSVLIIPTNVSSTATCVLCYLFLLYRIYKSHSKPHILKTLSRARKKISLVGLNLNSFIRTCKNNGMQRLLFINYKMIYMDYTQKK